MKRESTVFVLFCFLCGSQYFAATVRHFGPSEVHAMPLGIANVFGVVGGIVLRPEHKQFPQLSIEA